MLIITPGNRPLLQPWLTYFGSNPGASAATLFLRTDASGSLAGSTFINSRHIMPYDAILMGLAIEYVIASLGNITYVVQIDGVNTAITVTIPIGQVFGQSLVEVPVFKDQSVAVSSTDSAVEATAIHQRAYIKLRRTP